MKLKNQIISKGAKYKSLHAIKYFFKEIGWLDAKWEYSSTLLITNLDKFKFRKSNIDWKYIIKKNSEYQSS